MRRGLTFPHYEAEDRDLGGTLSRAAAFLVDSRNGKTSDTRMALTFDRSEKSATATVLVF